jgi:hypothetical protein
MSENYVQDVLSGDALWTEIEDYVEQWHNSESAEPSIADFLGMTQREYDLYVEQPASLRFILAAHALDEPVESLVQRSDEHLVAARGLSQREAEKVRRWLQHTGRLQAD